MHVLDPDANEDAPGVLVSRGCYVTELGVGIVKPGIVVV